ncbi:hypothetical protein O6H91_Y037200 [Diphasiastrum complanatum]|nr:hypothetical protein O6H91_Y434400 [Diphasiastrum complanatum]KAJ7297764.1 hypothetical protein O6H91_Y037200 [Diphasiastrum complanatum]
MPHMTSHVDDNGGDAGAKGPTICSFRTIASLRCMSPCLKASDVIGSIDYSDDGKLFATGGIARKIRICSYEALLIPSPVNDVDDEIWEEDGGDLKWSERSKRSHKYTSRVKALDHDSYSRAIICTPSKLSSVKWKPGYSCTIGCGDYDGTVAEWDMEHGCAVTEMHEHSGQRVYSLDYSLCSPSLAASASGDGTVKMWSHNSDKSVGVINSPDGKSFCCAEFNKQSNNLMAIACADSNVYLFDLRNLGFPLLSIRNHTRAASYVRWMAFSKLVSASIDSSLKLWDLSLANRLMQVRTSDITMIDYSSISLQDSILKRTYISHSNRKSFVGLSVMENGSLIACGSETNEVFIYQPQDASPVLQIKFPQITTKHVPNSLDSKTAPSGSFVSSVCWKNQGDHYSLIAGNSDGVVQVIKALPGKCT